MGKEEDMGSQERSAFGNIDILYKNDGRPGGSSGRRYVRRPIEGPVLSEQKREKWKKATQDWHKSALNGDGQADTLNKALDEQGLGGVEPVEDSGQEPGGQEAAGGDEGEASE